MSESWRNEALAVCRLLGDVANGRAFDVTTLPDEKTVIGFANVHRIITLVSGALRAVEQEKSAFPALHTVADTLAFHQIKNDLVTSQVTDNMAQAGVTILPLKGAAISAVYPDGWIRTASDTDLFVSPEQLDKACRVLLDMGFVRHESHDDDISFQKPPRSVVELHTSLGGFSKQQKQALATLSESPFSVNEQYVYALFHLYKHFLYAGAGVRMFFDIYCLSKAVTDRECAARLLGGLGLTGFESAVHEVCGVLFDGKDASEAMNEAVDLVIKSASFGTEETYYAMAHTASNATGKSRFRVWMTDHGFDTPAMTVRYPVLSRHVWLYPFCAVHRVVRGAIFKRTVLRHTVKAEHAADRTRIHRVLQTMNIL